ncbi:MAG TPA: ATP-dependent DNA helicase [Pseudolysinimonas sp.]|nr:ATP-dependent DNA helicase [Pseudolysinimonas sp.]
MAAIRFERGGRPVTDPIEPDVAQRAVLGLPDGRSAAVLGAPGSGKTATVIELVADRVRERGWSTDELLVIASTRAAATRLRDRIAVRLERPTNGPLARTVNSFAFEVVTAAARAAGAQPPRLLTGAEQDADLAALLEGDIADGTGPAWPDPLDAGVRRLRGFRTELRELMARATEYDVPPARLRELGASAGRPEWSAAADFIERYQTVAGGAREQQLDPAELARFAVAAIVSAPPDSRVAALRLVIVDDLHEATESTLAILRALAGRGIAIIAFGDPDVASNAFRGGEPDALGRLGVELGIDADTLVLDTVHRQGPALRSFVSRITERIGTAAAGAQRGAAAGGNDIADLPPVSMIRASTEARQLAAIARTLREDHLHRGVAWRDLAVVVRSGSSAPAIARALALAEVPTRTSSGGIVLHEAPVVRALLGIVRVAIGDIELDPALAAELLLGPFGGYDAIGLRRLRLALRVEELKAGEDATSDELLVHVLGAPGRLTRVDSPLARGAERLAATLDEVRRSDGSIEELLWIVWDRSGLARRWQREALGSGLTADEANRDLDAVVALFAAAKDFVERRPQGEDPRVIAAEFISEILTAELAGDILTAARSDDTVLVTTPSGAVGLEFRTVVLADLQEGVWPNLRLRGSLLAPQNLVRAVTTGAIPALDERKLVLDDELRLFALAVSRAAERVVLAAVSNDDTAESVFLGLVPPGLEVGVVDPTTPPLTLRGMTGRLRRTLTEPGVPTAEVTAAASTLAALAAQGLPGADPADWHGLAESSTTGPLYEGDTVRVSPSQIERIEESVLDWFLEAMAGGDSGVVANVGTILHWAMETTPDPTAERLWEAVEGRWKELVFESDWLAERHRRLARGFVDALADYLADFRRAGKTLAAAEGGFTLQYATEKLPEILVRGSIDRVEVDPDGAVVIVDLKTGRPKSEAEVEKLAQLGAYQLAYAEGEFDDRLAAHPGHRPGGAKLLFVREGTKSQRYREPAQRPLDDAGLEAVRTRILDAATLIAASSFDGPVELESYGGFGTTPRLRLHRVRAVSSD